MVICTLGIDRRPLACMSASSAHEAARTVSEPWLIESICRIDPLRARPSGSGLFLRLATGEEISAIERCFGVRALDPGRSIRSDAGAASRTGPGGTRRCGRERATRTWRNHGRRRRLAVRAGHAPPGLARPLALAARRALNSRAIWRVRGFAGTPRLR